MRVIIFKDGTVPIAVAELLFTDGFVTSPDPADEADWDRHEMYEVFEVPGRPEALLVSWADGEGFSVSGDTFAEGLKWLQEYDERPNVHPVDEVSLGHVCTTFGENPDDEGYGHVFDLRSVRKGGA